MINLYIIYSVYLILYNYLLNANLTLTLCYEKRKTTLLKACKILILVCLNDSNSHFRFTNMNILI